jgi:hypothetical protein
MGFQHLECDSSAKLIEEVMRATRQFEMRHLPGAIPFFRGHSSTAYQLLPSLFRQMDDGYYSDYDEENFYYEFRARAGSLLNPGLSSWDILFLMQHHRVPTRLLDWTESFSTALHFALENATCDIDIWMLDPYMLNKHSANIDEILDVEANITREYFDLFVKKPREAQPDWATAAINPRRQSARLASQHGLFTLHVARQPLEDMGGAEWLTRFRLSGNAADEAHRFLRVMGVNDFSLFPDLDGLGRLLRKRIKAGVPDPYR